jgi:hypothetical protein
MRRLYESLNRKKRAEQKRRDARECERAGFPMFAAINAAEAEHLDPPQELEDFTGNVVG